MDTTKKIVSEWITRLTAAGYFVPKSEVEYSQEDRSFSIPVLRTVNGCQFEDLGAVVVHALTQTVDVPAALVGFEARS